MISISMGGEVPVWNTVCGKNAHAPGLWSDNLLDAHEYATVLLVVFLQILTIIFVIIYDWLMTENNYFLDCRSRAWMYFSNKFFNFLLLILTVNSVQVHGQY